MEPTSTAEAVAQALAEHRDELVEGGVDQLLQIWARELDGASPAVAKEVVTNRLRSDPAWQHFKKAPGAAARPAAQAAGERPVGTVGFGSRTPQVLAGSERIGAQILANRAAALQGAAPGLSGTYGR